MKEPTVHDVALLAQVSIGTVSNVLNGRASVRPELVLRVTEAAGKLGYFRNSNAAGLRSNQTDTIAVVVPNIENAFFADIVTFIEQLGISDRRGVMFLTTSEDQDRAQRQIHNLISRRIDGLIFIPSFEFDFQPLIPNLQKYRVPVVLIDRIEAKNPFDTVAVDNRQAGRLGGNHLFSAGYKRIDFFAHDYVHWIIDERHQGFLEVAREVGAADLCQSHELSLSPEEIRDATIDILNRRRPEAIFAASNILAKGIIPAIQKLGLRIPEDIGLLVMDDFEALTMFSPGISVVAQPTAEIARIGWDMMRRLIARETPSPEHVRLPAGLIVRGSTPGPNKRSRSS